MLGIAHFQELHIFQQELKSHPILTNWHAILKNYRRNMHLASGEVLERQH